MKLSKFKSEQQLLVGRYKRAGRNHQGRITVRHQGGGNKQLYRTLDWSRQNGDGIITNFEYDPNRSAFLAKLFHQKTKTQKECFSYILAPKGTKILTKIYTYKEKVDNKLFFPGDATILKNFGFGDLIHNVEALPSTGALFARSAGTCCQILQHAIVSANICVRLPSGSHRLVSAQSLATMGIVGGENHRYKVLRKAGRSRWLNKRPAVRGVAMNPVDHPHGGGQGKTKGGRPSVTPSALPTKGQPTRNKRKKNYLILSPRSK